MKLGSILLGLLGVAGLGGVAMAASKSKTAGGSTTNTPPGKQWQLTFATSRPVTDTDLVFIQRAMTSAMVGGMAIQGIAITGPQEFKVNASSEQLSTPAIGSVGVLGSNPSDAITIQLVSAERVG